MEEHTAVGDTDGISRPQEIVRQRGDLSTIADGDGAVVSVRVIVDGLLVVLELDARQSESQKDRTKGDTIPSS